MYVQLESSYISDFILGFCFCFLFFGGGGGGALFVSIAFFSLIIHINEIK